MTRLYNICLLLALLFPLAAMSQDQTRAKGYEGSVEFYVGTGSNQMDKGKSSSGIQLVNGYRFNQWFTLGLGIGLQMEYWYPMRLPMHLDARFDLSNRKLRPFVQTGIGYGVTFGYGLGGINAQLALGYRIPIVGRLGIVTSIAGRLQGGSEENYGPVRVLNRYVEFRLGVAF